MMSKKCFCLKSYSNTATTRKQQGIQVFVTRQTNYFVLYLYFRDIKIVKKTLILV